MLGNATLWPVLVSLILIPSLTQVFGLYFVAVESPKYLYVNRDKTVEAENGIY